MYSSLNFVQFFLSLFSHFSFSPPYFFEVNLSCCYSVNPSAWFHLCCVICWVFKCFICGFMYTIHQSSLESCWVRTCFWSALVMGCYLEDYRACGYLGCKDFLVYWPRPRQQLAGNWRFDRYVSVCISFNCIISNRRCWAKSWTWCGGWKHSAHIV
jgi:hypothetical protein